MRASGSTLDLGHLPSHRPALKLFDADRQLADQHRATSKPYFAQRSDPAARLPAEVPFGPFRLLPKQFLLLEGDKPVSLGGRALEILTVLLERPGELVSKQELMARVWPNLFVEDANLTVHMSALRRTLRDGRDGNRYIINVHGRGYSFVAPIEVLGREISERDGSTERRH